MRVMAVECRASLYNFVLILDIHRRRTTQPREMIDAREFPVGSKPGWELEQPDSEQESSLPLKSVADRCFNPLSWHALNLAHSPTQPSRLSFT